MRRWLIRLTLAAVVLGLVLAGVVQAVLWSSLPRRIVASQLEAQTGLAVDLEGLTTGWGGTTRVEGLSVRLPLSDRPIAEVDAATLEHTGLLSLAATQQFTLDRLRAKRPTLNLRRLEDGAWNIERLISIVQANLPATEPSGGRALPLPELAIEDFTLTLDRGDDKDKVVVPGSSLSLAAHSGGAEALDLELTVPGLTTITGRVARRGPYTQNLRITLTDPADRADWVARLLGEGMSRLDATLTWRGGLAGGGIQGRLGLSPATFGEIKASGAARVEAGGDGVTLRPDGLELTGPPLPGPVTLAGGRVAYTGERIDLTALTARTLGGQVRLTGDVDTAGLTGELAVDWAGLTIPAGVQHAGRVTVDVNRARPGRRSIDCNVAVTGRESPLGPWRSELSLSVSGPAWDDLAGTVSLDNLVIERPNAPIEFRPINAELAIEPDRFAFRNLRFAGGDHPARLNCRGHYQPSTGSWALELAGRRLNVGGGLPQIERIDLAAKGDARSFTLEQSELVTAGLALAARGAYQPDEAARRGPLTGELTLKQVPVSLRQATGSLIRAENVQGRLTLNGSLTPLKLTGSGELEAVALKAGEEPLGDVRLSVEAAANDDAITLRTQELSLLDGTWRIDGQYRLDPAAQQRYSLTVRGWSLDLMRLHGAMGGGGLIRGTGRLTLDARGEALTLDELKVTGEFEGERLGLGPIGVESLTTRLAIRNGELEAHDIVATHENQGRLTGRIALPLDEPSDLSFDLALEPWSLLPGEAAALTVRGQLDGRFDAATLTGEATGRLDARFAAEQTPLLSLAMPLELSGDSLTIDPMTGAVLGGSATGQARLELREPLASELTLTWQEGRPEQLAALAPPLEAARGTLGGRITVGPAPEKHPRGPFRLRVTLSPGEDAAYDAIPLGETTVTLYYVNPERIVLNSFQSRVAGGDVTVWGRLSRHVGNWHLFASGEVDKLQLQPVIATFLPGREIVGLIDVTEATLITRLALDGPPRENLRRTLRSLHGRGAATVTQSDFAAIPLFSVFYDVLNLNIGTRVPAGAGETAFRFEEGRLLLENLRYENRGMRLRLLGLSIQDLLKGGESPIRGYALASLNPLPEIEAFEMINKAISTFQAGVTTVRLTNTLAEPKTVPVVFTGLTDSVRALVGTNDKQAEQLKDSEPAATQPGTKPE